MNRSAMNLADISYSICSGAVSARLDESFSANLKRVGSPISLATGPAFIMTLKVGHARV